MVHSNAKCRGILFGCAALWVLINAVYVSWEARVPHSDVFLFKEAGAKLALDGRFVASNLPHMPPDEELPYAYYAPLYPYLFGMWSKVMGLGLKQSIFFDHLLKLIRTLLIILFVWPWLKPRLNFLNVKGVSAAVFCLMMAFMPGDNDRPDELGLVFGLAAWINLASETLTAGGLLRAGLFLGLCGASSPTAALLFGAGAFAFLFYRRLKKRAWVLFSGQTLLTFLAICLPVLLQDEDALSRFVKQIPLSVFHYGWTGKASLFTGFRELVLTFWYAGKWTLVPLVILAGLTYMLWKRRGDKRLTEPATIFMWTSLAFIPFSMLVFNLQPRYLWFPTVTLFTLCLQIWLREEQRGTSNRIALVIGLALLPGTLTETLNIAKAASVSPTHLPTTIRDRVLSYIEPQAKLAISSDQYFTFRPYRNVSMAFYVCPFIDNFDYIYVTPHYLDIMNQEKVPSPCREKRGCFTAVEDFRDRRQLTLFGFLTRHYVNTSGGVLFKNTGCPAQVAAHDTPPQD